MVSRIVIDTFKKQFKQDLSSEYNLLKFCAKHSLHEFLRQAWPTIEGDTPFIDNWHIEAIATHLEAVYRRKIKKLIINVPPRTGKSNLISIAFPAWVWLQKPTERFLTVSCINSLSLEHAMRCRNLIESDWYQSRWGDIYKLAKDQNAKSYFQNDKTGYRQATSITSKTVGKGGSIIIIDDPNDPGDLSEVKREAVINWWTQKISTRSNNPKEDCKIVVQQRTHEQDLTGYIRKNDINEDWTELILPLEFETNRRCCTVPLGINIANWHDPRSKEGELLVPSRIGLKEVAELKKSLGSYGYAGQCQQRPSPADGGIIQRRWFKYWKSNKLPKFDYIIQSWDTAISDSPTASYSACTSWGVWSDKSGDNLFKTMLLSMWRDKIIYPDLLKRAKRLHRNYYDVHKHNYSAHIGQRVDICLIEAKATGDPLIRDLRKTGIMAIPYIPKGDKTSRVQHTAPYIECGCIYLPTEKNNPEQLQPHAEDFLENVITFPNSESRDLVDTMSQVISYLRDYHLASYSTDEEEED